MFQMKAEDKVPEEEPSEVEISNLSNKEVKVVVIKMLNVLGKRMDEHSKKFYKELENIRKGQTKLKNTITEINKILERISSRLDD